MQGKRTIALAAVAAGLLGVGVAGAKPPPKKQPGFQTAVKPYAKGLAGWETEPIISANDVVPETRNAGGQYRMVGIPDGLGVERLRGKGKAKKNGAVRRVWMTHELTQTDTSEPRVGRPAQRGAFASQLLLNHKGEVISARRAFDTVFQDSTLVGPAADASNTTPAFARWCSAFLAGRQTGFDRPIFLANEESGPVASGPTPSFSPKGSQSVAVFDNEAHALSKLGHFPRENTLVMRGTGKRTIILSTEDGPRTTDSQIYLYIGRKNRSSRDPLRRNGLDNGKLYVLASDDARDNENEILQGDTLKVHWEEIPNADQLTDVETEAAADKAGAFGFVRVEDGMFRPNAKREFWFNTTGDQAADGADPHINELGRLYRLRFNKRNPLSGARLTQSYSADQLTAAQDGPLSPDNLDVTKRFVIINEDGTESSRDDMEARNRDGSIWVVPRRSAGDPSTFQRVAELVGRSEGGRDGVKTTSGIWETSGIVAFGRSSFLFDVQAHAPTAPPGGKPVTVEDGQLLILRRGR